VQGNERGIIAGVDEAGRGPLAGPVVAAAVILDPARVPEGLDDSKKLTAARREMLFTQILETSTVGIAFAPPGRIATDNIRGATLWAMRRAVWALSVMPDMALIDGRDVPSNLPCLARAIIGGDGLEACIAAASIVAKVTRDRVMAALGKEHPGYGFEKHMGYGTAQHCAALAQLGVTPHHRQDFAPVRACLAASQIAQS
jgi:ribonuclease HII